MLPEFHRDQQRLCHRDPHPDLQHGLHAGAQYTLRVTGINAYVKHVDNYAGGAVYHPNMDATTAGDLPFQIYLRKENQVVISDAVYFGSPMVDGTWRMNPASGGFELQVRQVGSWTTVQTWAAP